MITRTHHEEALMNDTNSSQHPNVMIDLRSTPRVSLCVGVGFRSDTNFYAGFTDDLSSGGLFVATHDLQPIGTSLALTFHLPTWGEIVTVGVVRWIRDTREYNEHAASGMGVQFCGLRSKDTDAIRRFIALRDPIFYAA